MASNLLDLRDIVYNARITDQIKMYDLIKGAYPDQAKYLWDHLYKTLPKGLTTSGELYRVLTYVNESPLTLMALSYMNYLESEGAEYKLVTNGRHSGYQVVNTEFFIGEIYVAKNYGYVESNITKGLATIWLDISEGKWNLRNPQHKTLWQELMLFCKHKGMEIPEQLNEIGA